MASLRRLVQPLIRPSYFIRGLTTFCQRSHACNELTTAHEGRHVSLSGWLHSIRFKGKFLLLRDAHGLVQVFVPPEAQPKAIPPLDSVLRVWGCVHLRPKHQVNTELKTGEVEVVAEKVEILNQCDPHIPILGKDVNAASDPVRLRFRHLDLRRKEMADRLLLRSRLLLAMRRFLCERHRFCEVETPTLFSRTPGGAREFIVPTRTKGQFYSLVQSPQQFKQLLMVSGIDRYLQVARCYRDEDSRADRQPEFTQVDLEMSFVTAADVMALVEDLLLGVWPSLPDQLAGLSPAVPFPCLSHKQALLRFGSDKPDLRFDMQLHNLGEDRGPMVTAFVIPKDKLTKEIIDELEVEISERAGTNLSMTWLSKPRSFAGDASVDKTADGTLREAIGADLEDGVVVSTGDDRMALCLLMGNLRRRVAELLRRKGFAIYREGFHFLWINEFPLFERTEDGGITSTHHPFTAPLPDDEYLLSSNPLLARSDAFDLVCNGMEVAGGSIRIHDPKLQRHVLEDIMKLDPAALGHLISALSHGCPPHGGIAFGFDRLVAILCKVTSIRDVIAFPKSSDGRDIMSGAPSAVDDAILRYYHLI